MPGIKELKTRIKSISGTRKVTRAMQMVSAAKMRKSQDATMRSRTYASLAWELITNLSPALPSEGEGGSAGVRNTGNTAELSPSGGDVERSETERVQFDGLLQSYPQAHKIAVLILTTNRGMVGSLNANLLNLVQKTINEFSTTPSASRPPLLSQEGNTASPATPRSSPPSIGGVPPTSRGGGGIKQADIITYGRKGRDVMVRSHKEVLADFEKFDRAITTEDIYPIAELITKLYSSGKYQKVLIFYNHFVSTLAQKPTVKQLLPFASTTPSANAATPPLQGGEAPRDSASSAKPRSLSSLAKEEYPAKQGEVVLTEYLFEPTPQEVLKHLLPRIIESQIYQTILESEASEQSARMVMMKNATEAAGDLISDLTLTFNKLRQNKITTELAEITAGKIALE